MQLRKQIMIKKSIIYCFLIVSTEKISFYRSRKKLRQNDTSTKKEQTKVHAIKKQIIMKKSKTYCFLIVSTAKISLRQNEVSTKKKKVYNFTIFQKQG